jgi:hypothetical protein
MQFGLALDLNTTRTTLDRHFDAYIPLLARAADLGFQSVWAGETYPTGPSGSHLPSPLLALAALAPRTTLRLGTGVTLVPAWHPLRLAYDGAVLDQLRLETVADPGTLRKEGTGRFLPPEGTRLTPAEGVTIRQGTVEEPNSDAVLGMIDLVTIQRAYAANVDALKAMDGVLGTIASEVGKV